MVQGVFKGQALKYLNMSGFQQVNRILKDDYFVENPIRKFQSNQKLW